MICFDDVGKFVLSNITLHIPQGKTVGLIGASGAGKTTFLKLACGLLLPDTGKVYVMGKNPVGSKGMDSCFLSALFADKPFLNAEDTVQRNFELLSAVYRLPGKAFRKDYEELSRRLGFSEYEKEIVSDLSLGQRRRAELGAALFHRPELLLLDEPAIGLDEIVKLEFRKLLAERKRADNMAVVVTSHDMTEVSGMCDRLAFLQKGRLLFYGEKEMLRRSFLPREELILKVSDAMPDLEDLPLEKYSFNGEELRIIYRADFITSAEILRFVLRRCSVAQVVMRRPGLEEIVAELSGMGNELC